MRYRVPHHRSPVSPAPPPFIRISASSSRYFFILDPVVSRSGADSACNGRTIDVEGAWTHRKDVSGRCRVMIDCRTCQHCSTRKMWLREPQRAHTVAVCMVPTVTRNRGSVGNAMARSPCPGYSKMRQRTETTDLRPIRPISEAREHQSQSYTISTSNSSSPVAFVKPHPLQHSRDTKSHDLLLQDQKDRNSGSAQAQTSSLNTIFNSIPSLVTSRHTLTTKRRHGLHGHEKCPPRSVSFSTLSIVD